MICFLGVFEGFGLFGGVIRALLIRRVVRWFVVVAAVVAVNRIGCIGSFHFDDR